MTEDDTTLPLRDEILRVLDGSEPLGIKALQDALPLGGTQAEMVGLAATLHSMSREGANAAERTRGVKGRPFRYRLLGAGEIPPAPPPPRKAARPPRKPQVSAPRPERLEAACAALEQALVALVQDPATLAVVRAYVALKAQP
jgi:hypothetical protein